MGTSSILVDSGINLQPFDHGNVRVDWTGMNAARPYGFTPHAPEFRKLVVSGVTHGFIYPEGHPIGTAPAKTEGSKLVEHTATQWQVVLDALREREFKCTLTDAEAQVTVSAAELELWLRDHRGDDAQPTVNTVAGFHRYLAYPFMAIIRAKRDMAKLGPIVFSVHKFSSSREMRDANITENTLRNIGVTRVKPEHLLAIAVRMIKRDKLKESDLVRLGLANSRYAAQKIFGAAMLHIKVPDVDLLGMVQKGICAFASLDKETSRALWHRAESATSEQMPALVAEVREFAKKGAKKESTMLTRGELSTRKGVEDIVFLVSEQRTILKEDTDADRARLEAIHEEAIVQALNELVYQIEQGNLSTVQTILLDRAARLAKAAG